MGRGDGGHRVTRRGIRHSSAPCAGSPCLPRPAIGLALRPHGERRRGLFVPDASSGRTLPEARPRSPLIDSDGSSGGARRHHPGGSVRSERRSRQQLGCRARRCWSRRGHSCMCPHAPSAPRSSACCSGLVNVRMSWLPARRRGLGGSGALGQRSERIQRGVPDGGSPRRNWRWVVSSAPAAYLGIVGERVLGLPKEPQASA